MQKASLKNLEKEQEGKIQADILRWLNMQPKAECLAWRNYTGPIIRGGGKKQIFFTANPAAGGPDIIVIFKGRFVGIEVKTKKGKLSEKQEGFMKNATKAGAFYFVVTSLDEAQKCIKQVKDVCIETYLNRRQ